MATVKVKFRSSTVSAKEGTLYYQVIHNRIARQIRTGYKLYPTEWEYISTRKIAPGEMDESRLHYLAVLQGRVKEDVKLLKGIISRLERNGETYTSEQVAELYSSPINEGGFLAFSQSLVAQLRQIGKTRTAETYTTTLNSFMRFRGEKGDISLDNIETNLMVEYETFLKSNGVCPNSSSYYMRNLRAIYNRAVDKGLTAQRFPFKHVYTGIDKTVKRAVSVKTIREIRDLDLTLHSSLDYARDMFMFSFYTRGMSFVDMAYLRKKDLQNGVLSYRRQKTGQQLFIKWEQPMQEIVAKYDTAGTPYLLPIIKSTHKDERRQYKNAEHLVNNNLKKIGKQLGLGIPLTTYVARHGWASIAKSNNIPLSVISEAMGHDSEQTTRIYLASLDTSVVDKANSLVLESL